MLQLSSSWLIWVMGVFLKNILKKNKKNIKVSLMVTFALLISGGIPQKLVDIPCYEYT